MKKLLILPIYYTLCVVSLPFLTTLFMPARPLDSSPPDYAPEEEQTISVFNHLTNTTENMKLEDYLIGVVAAEMPAAFENEALKAQAVAARTYTFYKAASTDHDADICTDSSHCQAYLTEYDMYLNWQNDYPRYYEKVKDAVYSTKGEIITYDSKPVMAVFHSMGGGKTESSADVWGGDYPYLVSVESPGEEEATNYHSTLTVTFDEFKNKITEKYPDITISSPLDISKPTLTQGGHVKSLIIGGKTIEGTLMRTIFNLRSTKFSLSFSDSDNTVTFSVTGYGHGVGMSQYGANAMAKEGKTYKDILSHYYQGTTLTE